MKKLVREARAANSPGRSQSRSRTALGRSAFLGAILLLSAPAAQAATKYAAEFMKIGVGARALGMGGAFVALADDASASYWNPAGLARLDRAELMFMHAEQLGDLANHDYFTFAQPLQGGSRQAVGIGLIRLGIDDIKKTADHFVDSNGNGRWDPGERILVENFETGSDTDYGLLLTYAREMSPRWSLGGNAKFLRQGLLDNTSFGFGLDLGVLYDLGPGMTLGLRVADFTTTRLSWDTGTKESVAPSVVVGAHYSRAVPALSGRLNVGADLARSFDGREEASQAGGSDFQGGIEYWHLDAVAARVGSDAGNMTAGAGLRYRGLGVDYAYLANPDLDASHRVSASVRF